MHTVSTLTVEAPQYRPSQSTLTARPCLLTVVRISEPRNAVRAALSFPNPVNEVSARLVAAGVVIMAAAYVITGWWPLLAVLAYGFVARVLSGPRFSPLGLLVTRVVTPRLGLAPRLVPGPPKRFAQGIGAVVSTTALVLAVVADQPTAARAVVSVLDRRGDARVGRRHLHRLHHLRPPDERGD